MLKDKQAKDAKQGQRNMCSTQREANKHVIKKRGCPRRKNVGLDQVSIVLLAWSTNDT